MDHTVIIAGGGPVGLTLAAELRLAGVDVAIIEQRADQTLTGSRAGGLHPRTLELFAQRGIADRFTAEGSEHSVIPIPGATQDISSLPTRFPYWLGIWQNRIEQILADWAQELGVIFHRTRTVTDFTEDADCVTLSLEGGAQMRARYLVGCDGGRSLVRKCAGIDFPGWDATASFLIAEADYHDEPEWGIRYAAKGINGLGKLEDGKRLRCVLTEAEFKAGREPDIRDLKDALITAYGTDFGVHNVTWLSRFTDATRQAAHYRKGRVLLAGDAAHVHSPAGGQGLNIGVQDAMNLGWKLAQVVHGTSPDSLLDSYHRERHPVGARALSATMALNALHRGDPQTDALRTMMGEMSAFDDVKHWYAARMSGLDVRYDLGEGHALLGRRMPDIELATATGTTTVSALLYAAKPVLVSFTDSNFGDLTCWSDRVRTIHARYSGSWELPVIGTVTAPGAVLIRPDGYVAWTDHDTQKPLQSALATWC
ncbi:FAD-dependent monooxygenase [Kordiimonas gwangyangensis]|uniref:FAD-dependent monooxygenase n=1 Tax=Kordiimonas gwangyangensis TaxID=288022 RepID=UPI00036B4229|nr:FAD-dependent monooxygenase [Kordiimonas gwangyangensis]